MSEKKITMKELADKHVGKPVNSQQAGRRKKKQSIQAINHINAQYAQIRAEKKTASHELSERERKADAKRLQDERNALYFSSGRHLDESSVQSPSKKPLVWHGGVVANRGVG